MIKFASGGDSEQQRVAVKALGEMGSDKSLPVLQTLLASNDAFLRHEAERAVESIRRRQR